MHYRNTGTSDEAGGFPNVEFNPDHSVEGCVYAITETELCMLDNCMGYPKVSGKRARLYNLFHGRVRSPDISIKQVTVGFTVSPKPLINSNKSEQNTRDYVTHSFRTMIRLLPYP